MVPCSSSNRGNQQCLPLRVGSGLGLWGSVTFVPAKHPSHAARCTVCLFKTLQAVVLPSILSSVSQY